MIIRATGFLLVVGQTALLTLLGYFAHLSWIIVTLFMMAFFFSMTIGFVLWGGQGARTRIAP